MVLSGVCLFEGGSLKKGTPSYFAGVPELAFCTNSPLKNLAMAMAS